MLFVYIFLKSACCASDTAVLSTRTTLPPLLGIMSVEDIRGLLRDLTAVGTDMDPDVVADMQKTCAIIEDMTAQKAKRLVEAAGHNACLSVFQSDGWSTDVRTKDKSFVGNVVVTRTGRLRTEFAMQRSILKAKDQFGEVQCAVVIARPRCLGSKKCPDLWSAATEFFPMLKLLKHPGISLSLYLQDGLFAKPFAKRMLGRHDMFFDAACFPLACDRAMSELRDWCFTWHCVAHSCSLALKWGLGALVVGEKFTEAVHVAVSGLLRASTGLLNSVQEFIGTSVAFDLPDPSDPSDIEFLWSYLDVPPQLLDVFIRVCPRWQGGRLHVRASLVNEEDATEAITVCIKHCMRWCDFSETRWTKVGECGRLFMKSLLVGADNLVAIACNNSAVSQWHLNGFIRKASSSVRLYLGVAAVAAKATESMLLDLMEDDRFLIHEAKCWQTMEDELDIMLKAPPYFWDTLADVLGVAVTDFQGHVLQAVVVSMAYMFMDVWMLLSQPPWCYCRGDIACNIEALKAAEAPTDATSCKIHMLASLGFEEEVVAALQLLTEASFTTIMVEQAHGSGAQLMSRHPQVGPEIMTARMTVHNSRVLFAPSHFEKSEAKLQMRIGEIDQAIKNADSHTTARNAFLKMMVAHIKSRKRIGGPSQAALRKGVFQQHALCFSALSPSDRVVCEKEAEKSKRRKIDALSSDRDHVEAQLELLRTRHAASLRAFGKPNHLESQRFTQEDFEVCAEKWQQYTADDCKPRLKPPPSVIPPALEALLERFMGRHDSHVAACPAWVSALVGNRDAFEGCGLYPAVVISWVDLLYFFSFKQCLHLGTEPVCAL